MKKILFVFIFIFLVGTNAVAVSHTVTFNFVKSDEKIKSAQGILVDAKQIKFIDDVKIINTNSLIKIVFNIDGANSNFVGAVIEKEDGEREYSGMKALSSFAEKKELAECVSKVADITLLAGQESLLIELVEVRNKRKDLLDKNIETLFSPDLIFMLTNLEKYFGFTYDAPIDLSLSKEDLLVRLERIKIALNNVDVHKASRMRIERAEHIIKNEK